MGDLHCPARVFVVDAADAARWGERLRWERVAAVYADASGAPAAADAARTLQVPATVVRGAGAPHDRPQLPEECSSAPERVRSALADIADRHRGEAVLLVDATGSFAAALRLLVPGWAGLTASAADGLAAFEADADGWRRVTTTA